jgi:hypothetical protein
MAQSDLTFAVYSHSLFPVSETNSAPGKIIYLGAYLIAAVRLAKEESWTNSLRVVSRISDSINMAKRIYDRMKDEYNFNGQ